MSEVKKKEWYPKRQHPQVISNPAIVIFFIVMPDLVLRFFLLPH
jgi:hypothetical protein